MIKKTLCKTGGGIAIPLLLSACATGNIPQQALSPELPDWIVSQGFVSTECVAASSNLSIDRKEALSKAQVALAQLLEAKIKTMDKILMEKNGGQASNHFSSRSSVDIDTTLRGAVTQRQDYVNIRGKEHFCLQIAIPKPEQTFLFNNVVQTAKLPLTEQDKKKLYAVYVENLIIQGDYGSVGDKNTNSWKK